MRRIWPACLLALQLLGCGSRAAPESEPECDIDTCALPPGVFTTHFEPSLPCVDAGPGAVYCLGTSRPRYVELTRRFEIARSETTREHFEQLMGFDPAGAAGDKGLPVTGLTWHLAAAFCNARSERRGLDRCYRCATDGAGELRCESASSYVGSAIYDCPGYRLPTRAEWTYAYRAGTTTLYYNGTPKKLSLGTEPLADAIGWWDGNTTALQLPRLKPANPWGLYDIAGNAEEWAHDLGSRWWQHPDDFYPSGDRPDPSLPRDVDPVSDHPGFRRDASPVLGGSWGSYLADSLSYLGKGSQLRDTQSSYTTVRCVRTLPPNSLR